MTVKLQGADPETMQLTQLALVYSQPMDNLLASKLKSILDNLGAQNCYSRNKPEGTEIVAMFKQDRLNRFWDECERAYMIEVSL